MLIYLYKSGGMKGVTNWKNATLSGPYDGNNRSYAKNVLELCQLVVTEEEQALFSKGENLTDEILAKAAHGIQQRAFDQMAVFEGLTSTKGGKKKATFVVVGHVSQSIRRCY